MTKLLILAIGCAVGLVGRPLLAAPTAQQNCDYARITAWKKYVSCIEGVVAKDAKGIVFDDFAAAARCRHIYFHTWAGFQSKPSLAGSTCVGPRFSDNGETVLDNLSSLTWEKKDNLQGVHDQSNSYSWSTGAPYAENGTAFSDFLATLNGTQFAGASGWRLPTFAELQTIVDDFTCRGIGRSALCRCSSSPCIALSLGLAANGSYWAATTEVSAPARAWLVSFIDALIYSSDTIHFALARGVRGGI